jgi:hypothetical protein
MVQVLFVWNAEYAALGLPPHMARGTLRETARFIIGTPHNLLLPIGLLALVGATDLLVRKRASSAFWLLPAWAVAMMVPVWVQDRYYTYHWLPVLPPLGLLAAQGLVAIRDLLVRSMSRRDAAALSAAVSIAAFGVLGYAYWFYRALSIRCATGQVSHSQYVERLDRAGRRDVSLREDRAVADFIRRNTSPDERILVWGFEPLIYFMADRPPATRFIYTVPLVTAWSPPEWRQEVLSDIARKQPAFVVVAHNDYLPWMTGRSDDSAGQLAGFTELYEVLSDQYEPTERLGDFAILERRDRER